MTIFCIAATTINLVGTYNNGNPSFPGQGATFTFTATDSQSIDSILLNAGLPFLLKNQTDETQNGVYYVTTQGTPGVHCVLTRYPGAINNTEPLVSVVSGITQFQTIWSLSTPVSEIGTDDIIYVPVGSQNGITTITTVTAASYGVNANDRVIVCNRAGTVLIGVEDPTTTAAGTALTIKDASGNASANNITISPSGGNIDGSTTLIINTNYGSYTIVCNGTEWSVI